MIQIIYNTIININLFNKYYILLIIFIYYLNFIFIFINIK